MNEKEMIKRQADNISKLQDKIRLLEFEVNEERKENTYFKNNFKLRQELINRVREKLEMIIRTKEYERLSEVLQVLKAKEYE